MAKLILGLFFFVFMALVPFAFGIGIGPADTVIEFQPGLEKTFSNIVINNGNEWVEATIYVKPGPLSGYVMLPDNLMVNVPPGGRASFGYTLRLPAELPTPGFNDLFVGVAEGSRAAGTFSVATAATTRLRVFVPYPGKYAEISFSAASSDVGKPVAFTVDISNKGTSQLDSVSGTIDILQDGAKLDSLQIEPFSLNLSESRQVSIKWAKGKKAGSYKAIAMINYDGQSKQFEQQFRIGEEKVKIINITDSAEPGRINRLTVIAESQWSSVIKDAHAEFAISHNGTNDKIASLAQDIQPWSSWAFDAYWDTSGVEKGSYRAKASIHYSGKVEEKDFIINVRAPGESQAAFNPLIATAAFVAIIIVATILNVYVFSRKGKGK